MNANRIHTFCRHAIEAGRVILIYKGVTDPKPMCVTDHARLSVRNGKLMLDGMDVSGYTVAIKP